MQETELILRESWKRLIAQYTSGKVILRNERGMESALKDICRNVMVEHGLSPTVVSQEPHRGRIVDLRIGEINSCLLVQLKLYHDRADWKETPSMINTVESDLKFAKGHKDTYLAIIDTIPSTPRAKLPFKLNWQIIEIDREVFDKVYSNINPRTSPPRESRQKILLTNGTEI